MVSSFGERWPSLTIVFPDSNFATCAGHPTSDYLQGRPDIFN
jgi:hypothetical protein